MMDRPDAYRRKLGTIVESLEELPDDPHDLSRLEREGVQHLVQVATDAAMDVTAMLVKDHGQRVRDDYHNLQEAEELGVVEPDLADRLRTLNGLRNAIVHRYDRFEEDEVLGGLDRIAEDLTRFVHVVDDLLEERT